MRQGVCEWIQVNNTKYKDNADENAWNNTVKHEQKASVKSQLNDKNNHDCVHL